MVIYPRHRVTAGAVVIRDDNKILLIEGPQRGWELPGGHVEEGESIHHALKREVKEETGIDIKIIRFCGISQEVNHSILNTWWIAKPINHSLSTSSESLQVKYVDVEEAMKMIKIENFKKELRQILETEKHPFHIVFM